MKFSAISSLILLVVGTLAAPSALPEDEPATEVIRINIDDLPPALESRQQHNEATLQAWRNFRTCPGTPDFTWHPVNYAVPASPSGHGCYEYWSGGNRIDILSIMFTGPWGGTCFLRAYGTAGCSGTTFVPSSPFQCNNRNNQFIRSFRVVCA